MKLVQVIVLAGIILASASALPAQTVAPHSLLFDYEWVGDIDRIEFNEPSGIVYHAGRGTLFVVGDAGDLCEIKTDGALVKQARLRSKWPGSDFEGVTYDPATGLVYIAVEGAEQILEVNPDTFEVLREFSIEREFEDVEILKPGGQGIEGITFIPDPAHPEGGTFYLSNQGFEFYPAEDPSVIVEVVAPLRTNSEKQVPAKIVRALHVGVPDIAGFHYDAASGHMYIVSDGANALFEITRDGDVLRGWAFPGDNQEGIAFDPDWNVYIAQDSGGILKLKWKRDAQPGV